ncbi:Lysophospholipase, alpha-beta hydrolase superfamily [Mycolicibacterium neoaurum]|uniref:Lysophospholipase n=1 Tax=Mycolicibacterium neoaurum TaxID=1795 RepID=A0AAV2WFS5_MYCNE|nr:alpha/beta hydrolase [Mycolicibacterium neoaurum]TLH63511.1 alpha/beta hydrolase [Mycolicibacterium neoaurum]CDQ43072.1 lysophospholipase [Mycolicibacterium neoaurum]SDE35734.1 Lysophospholipase, alpha-beta hydrolase superfamily [Mycolicibacterium neoaurum]
MTGWEPDVLPGYWQHQLPLGADPDGEGELVATLVSRDRPQPRAARAVLVVHGYTDYFFHTELADHLAGRGFACYALDLPKCGRSRRAGQTPHFTSDLAHYDSALQAALTAVDAEQVLMYGHSAGGLILSLWLDRLHRRGATGPITGLVLNSPFLDLHGPAVLRTPPTSAALMALARVRKLTVVRKPGVGGYGTTLHRDFAGEFDYNLDWKPVGGFPITFGWINAIRRGQRRLHRGLDIGVPSLILRSDHSVAEVSDPDLIQRGDAVLDVDQIARWAGCVGNRLTVVPITDAKHDVFLSLPEPRAAAYRELDTWLDWYLTSGTTSTAPHAG